MIPMFLLRLSSILKKKTLSPKKLDEIKIKANILTAFVEQKVSEAAEVVADEEEAQVHLKTEF